MSYHVTDLNRTIQRLRKDYGAATHLAATSRAATPADPQSHPHSRGHRRGPVQHEWSKGPWKHKPQPIEPNNPFLALTFWALLIFCCVLAAASIGYQLSQPL